METVLAWKICTYFITGHGVDFSGWHCRDVQGCRAYLSSVMQHNFTPFFGTLVIQPHSFSKMKYTWSISICQTAIALKRQRGLNRAPAGLDDLPFTGMFQCELWRQCCFGRSTTLSQNEITQKPLDWFSCHLVHNLCSRVCILLKVHIFYWMNCS